MATCADCRFLSKVDNHAVCRRYPPTVNSVPVMTPPDVRNPNGGVSVANQVIIPPVDPGWWCGEYSSVPSPLKIAP